VDWIFVLDTSASMHGAGGTADIFGKVKEAISGFIQNARNGDTVTLYTFDRDTTLRGHIRISTEIDKKDLLQVVQDLPSEGDRTYTGKAIHDALERAIALRQRSDAVSRTVSIVLFTDGLEDVRGLSDPITIPSNIALLPKAQPYIFFVSVGVQAHETQLESFVKDPAMGNRGEVIRDPGATGIAEVGERIRKVVEAPVIHPRPQRVEDEFISLTQLHARKVCLSSLVANTAVDASDAELEAMKLNGELRINLQRTKGNVYVNKIEVANSRIYNDDVIELGGSKLLFSWVNHDRPSGSEEPQPV
jgi:hypothetical protein